MAASGRAEYGTWELWTDWAKWQRWWPQGEVVFELREGENRRPGCLRYIEAASGLWMYERLLQVDDENFLVSYRLEDNVLCGGVKGYSGKAQFRGTSEGKAVILEYWRYELDPMARMTREAFAAFMEAIFRDIIVKGIESGARRLAAGLTPLPAPQEVAATQ